jgi:hypothetical protein
LRNIGEGGTKSRYFALEECKKRGSYVNSRGKGRQDAVFGSREKAVECCSKPMGLVLVELDMGTIERTFGRGDELRYDAGLGFEVGKVQW